MGLIVTIIALSFVVFFHELGHFLAARFFGVKVETFSVGFGNKIFQFNHKGTCYAISLIPLGGYVKLKGEGDCSLLSIHPLARVCILLAGPLFNFILAFLIYISVFMIGVPQTSKEPIIGYINPNIHTAKLLKENDRILSVNGIFVDSFSDISKILSNEPERREADVLIMRDDKELNLKINLHYSEEAKRALIGISPLIETRSLPFLDSIQEASNRTIEMTTMLYGALKGLILGAIGMDNVSGIIGIADVSNKAYNVGLISFLWVIALISINLGIINLLPIPMLDGGQILFTMYEWLSGNRLNENAERILIAIGIGFVVALMALGIYNDINRLIQ